MTLVERSQAQPTVQTLADGHVHLHPCFELPTSLEVARRNFTRAAASLGTESVSAGVLLLTESAGVRRIRAILEGPLPLHSGPWTLEACGDGLTVLATHGDGSVLYLVEGRQIATRERLEVLGLACQVDLPDGRPLEEVLQQVLDGTGVAVIPWGFGKWWFARGRFVASILESADPNRVFLGDNGGRPRGLPRPRLLRAAEDMGFRVVPGTDPLPFPREVHRIGSYGFTLDLDLASAQPATDLTAHLTSPDALLTPYGAGTPVPAFALNQLAMQWRQRFAGTR